MLCQKEFKQDESTFVVPSRAPDEVVSGWSVNLQVCMPMTVHTHNKQLIIVNLLSKSELSQIQHRDNGQPAGPSTTIEEAIEAYHVRKSDVPPATTTAAHSEA